MTTGKRVLIVDDDPDIVASISAILGQGGYQASSALNGEEGLAEVRKTPPDLIILDLIMPKKSGTKFMDEIRRDPRLNQIPIIILSGASQVTSVDMKGYFESRPFKERREKALGPEPEGNVKAYVEKGGDASALLEAVKKYI